MHKSKYALAISVLLLLGVFPAQGALKIVKIYDGDTVTMADGMKIRLLQIDAPELGENECFAKESKAALVSLLAKKGTVTLKADPASASYDRYGRALRYIFVGKLNVNPNAGHLILEDDIIIDDKFLDKLKKLIPHIPSDWGILYFGMGEKKLKNVKNEIGEVEFGWGCYGFMIKHSKIPEILSKINKMYAPIDNMILDNFKELCAYATVEDMIFATGAEVSSIG
jgi:hypothetical protein